MKVDSLVKVVTKTVETKKNNTNDSIISVEDSLVLFSVSVCEVILMRLRDNMFTDFIQR